jgi:phage-related protein
LHQHWSVEFYTERDAAAPALEFLKSLPAKDSAPLLRALDLLEEFGTALGMPRARPIEGLWELQGGSGRLFYFGHTGRRFIILHGYRKKSQKTPKREIDTAKRRWADFLEREHES